MRKLFFAGIIALALSSNAIAQQAVTIRQSNGAGPVPATAVGLNVRQVDGADVTQGAIADAACATDNGVCTISALIKRMNQRTTSLIGVVGSPFQAGGSIGNTSFGISGTLPAFAATPTFNVGTVPGTLATSAAQATAQTSFTAMTAALGTPADAAWVTGNGTIPALLKTIANGVLDTSPALVNIGQVAGATIAQGHGLAATAIRVELPTDGTGQVVLGTGANVVGAVNLQPTATSGGMLSYNLEPAATDNHATIKNGAGQVYNVDAFTIHTAAQFLRLYDAGTGFNGCGSATGLMWSAIIPAGATGAGLIKEWVNGRPFTNGLSVCVTGAYGNTATTAATASVSEINVSYK